ncbi:MAG: hypothetical protein ACKO2V_07500 [Snowella sp.]
MNNETEKLKVLFLSFLENIEDESRFDAEQSKERQKEAIKARDELGRAIPVTEKIQELGDNLDPETAANIAVEMGENVKPAPNERRTDHKVAKLHGTNRTYQTLTGDRP